jgi:hypothetical protein
LAVSDLTIISRKVHNSAGHFTQSPHLVLQQPATVLPMPHGENGRNTTMKSFLRIGRRFFGSTGSQVISARSDQSAAVHHGDRTWAEDFLVGMSDMDAIWFYERQRMRIRD